MKHNQLIFVGIIFVLMSYNRIANKTKEGINKGSKVVGESTTEFFEGVSKVLIKP